MRFVVLVCLVFSGCSPTLSKPCLGDGSCTGEEVCSGSSGPPFCTLPCDPSGQEPEPAVSYCASALGAGSNCEKYLGPDSAGYACAPPR